MSPHDELPVRSAREIDFLPGQSFDAILQQASRVRVQFSAQFAQAGLPDDPFRLGDDLIAAAVFLHQAEEAVVSGFIGLGNLTTYPYRIGQVEGDDAPDVFVDLVEVFSMDFPMAKFCSAKAVKELMGTNGGVKKCEVILFSQYEPVQVLFHPSLLTTG